MGIRKSAIIVSIFFLSPFIFSCLDDNEAGVQRSASASDIAKGKELASVYCQSCHLLPDPSYLDGKTWANGVLPIMGPRLGIFEHNKRRYPYSRFDLELGKDFYPAKPVLTDEQWQYIIDYYSSSAPDSLPLKQSRKYEIKNDTTLFSPLIPSFKYYSPSVSFVKIDTVRKGQPVIIADATKNLLYRFDKDLNIFDSVRTKSPLVDIRFNSPEWIACNIGILNPNNGTYGSVTTIKFDKNGKLKEDTAKLFSRLQRPVDVTDADLNMDGKKDYVVCQQTERATYRFDRVKSIS